MTALATTPAADPAADPSDATPAAGRLRRLQGQKYSEFLDDLHARMTFDWYMEVGCRAGRTFGPVASNTIAVDPYFRAETNIIGAKRRLFVFQETSDDFFATGFLAQAGIRLSFSFLDGMHLMEFLLRDFRNTEANSRPDGVIAMHDCIPFNTRMTTRDHDNHPRGPWTGDVWKLLPILREYRPDLRITPLACRPTGLVLVSGLNPDDRRLWDAEGEILARFRDLTLDDYGPARFSDELALVDPAAFVAANYAHDGYAPFAAVRRDGHGPSPQFVTR